MAEPRTDEPEADAETLRLLQARLERATTAAERLLGQAAMGGDSRPADGEVPPAGWQWRTSNDAPPSGARWVDAADAERLFAVLAGVLDFVPLELQQRLVSALRELLLALRALIDWCLERAERRRAEPAEVQDIPIL